MFLDQHGNRFYADSVRKLRKQIGNGSSRVEKMFRDKKDGGAVQIGYVIGGHWLTAYQRVEIPA